MCRDEVRALQALDHANVLKCYAAIEDEVCSLFDCDVQVGRMLCFQDPEVSGPRLTLILEYVHGKNLEDHICDMYIKSKRRHSREVHLVLYAQIASAIEHVHQRRILHRGVFSC